MPQKDTVHEEVKNALVKEGWKITADPYRINFEGERIFIDIKGVKVPYFITNVRGSLDLIFQLEDVKNKEAAFSLQSREIFLRPQDLIPEHRREIEVIEDSLEYEHLNGFMLVDQTAGEIGVIDAFVVDEDRFV